MDIVIFDCDGVLVDSEPLYNRIGAQELAREGCVVAPEELARRFCGTTLPEMIATLSAETGQALPDDLAGRILARCVAEIDDGLSAIDGVHAMLDRLDRPAGVASGSHPAALEKSLVAAGLHGRFAPHIYSASMVERGKPAPDLFLHACAEIGGRSDRAVVVEDSVHGVAAGCAAGMTVIGFVGASHLPPGHAALLREAGAAEVVDDMRALGDLLAG